MLAYLEHVRSRAVECGAQVKPDIKSDLLRRVYERAKYFGMLRVCRRL